MRPELRTAITERLKEFEPELRPSQISFGVTAIETEPSFRVLLIYLNAHLALRPCPYCGAAPDERHRPTHIGGADSCPVPEAYNRIFLVVP